MLKNTRGKVVEHIELKLKLIRELKSQTMIVPRGTSNGNGSGDGSAAVPRGTSKGLVTIPVADFLNTVSIHGSGGTENHVIIKDGNFIIAHCKILNGTASVVRDGWAGRSYALLEMLREVGYV